MKKIVAVAAATTLAFSLAACESQAEEETEAAAEVLDEQAELNEAEADLADEMAEDATGAEEETLENEADSLEAEAETQEEVADEI